MFKHQKKYHIAKLTKEQEIYAKNVMIFD